MDYLKKVLYYVFAPIFVPLTFFFHILHDWKHDKSFMEKLWNSRNPFALILFGIISIVFFPLMLFMNLFFGFWEKAGE